jgi:hypothetical protein
LELFGDASSLAPLEMRRAGDGRQNMAPIGQEHSRAHGNRVPISNTRQESAKGLHQVMRFFIKLHILYNWRLFIGALA